MERYRDSDRIEVERDRDRGGDTEMNTGKWREAKKERGREV